MLSQKHKPGLTGQFFGGHSRSPVLPSSFPVLNHHMVRHTSRPRSPTLHSAADTSTLILHQPQVVRTKIHSREKKQGAVELLSALATPPPPPPSWKTCVHPLCATHSSHRIKFLSALARHSPFISRMFSRSSTNMSQCDTARRFAHRPQRAYAPRRVICMF